MTTRPIFIITCILLTATSQFAFSQTQTYRSDADCEFGYRGRAGLNSSASGFSDYGYSHRKFGSEDLRQRNDRPLESLRGRYQHELSRLRNGYDYQAPLDSAVDDLLRRPVSDTRSQGRDFRDSYSDRQINRGRLEDPFRFPSTDDFRREERYRPAQLSRDSVDDRFERRYRIPIDRVDYSDYSREFTPQNDYRSGQDRYQTQPMNYELRDRNPLPSGGTQRGLDPFTPPLPRRESGSEAEAIFNAISSRYGNPVNVRAVRAMSAAQSLSLYREVSHQTDQRHLEPTSYDLRVRRGLRNLSLALENPTFNAAFGVQGDSFRMDGFRNSVSRMADSMQVRNRSDAERIMTQVMGQARQVGLPQNVVAFEFASATVDTLDKFSALEPSEPGREASIDLTETVRSAMLEGEIVGVGVELKAHEQGLMIVKPLRGGPAAEAGLKAGDVITSINGRDIRGVSMATSVDMMKGGAGSRLQLTISRNGSRGGNVTLVRRRVRIYTVNDVRMQPNTDQVAYISLSQFGQKSTEELDQALQQMYQSGMKSLILDLRGNPGGLLNICVDITNRFLPCGTIVSTKGRLSSDNMHETATYSRTWSTPLVVLIDGDSASASEIFAAAVQDNQRGIVVGERSYGKGTVQTHLPLSSIGGNLRLTTARFYSPSGRAMSGEGVTPDVQIADADGPANGDRVLDQAIQIAQSQRLRDIAQAAARCRDQSDNRLQRNTMKGDIYDSVAPKTVFQ